MDKEQISRQKVGITVANGDKKSLFLTRNRLF